MEESYKKLIPKNSRVLHLTVTKEWFDKIASGEKPEDFREFKAHWITRLLIGGHGESITGELAKEYALDWTSFSITHMLGGIAMREYDYVVTVNGYGLDKPTIISRFKATRVTEHDEKTDLGVGRFFAIDVSNILKIINLKALEK